MKEIKREVSTPQAIALGDELVLILQDPFPEEVRNGYNSAMWRFDLQMVCIFGPKRAMFEDVGTIKLATACFACMIAIQAMLRPSLDGKNNFQWRSRWHPASNGLTPRNAPFPDKTTICQMVPTWCACPPPPKGITYTEQGLHFCLVEEVNVPRMWKQGPGQGQAEWARSFPSLHSLGKKNKHGEFHFGIQFRYIYIPVTFLVLEFKCNQSWEDSR